MLDAESYLLRASEGLAGAESEFAAGRFNNCANRCYFACFHAAITALILDRRQPPTSGRWTHTYVQAEFAGYLITRAKRYPPELRDTLSRNMDLRHAADYHRNPVSEIAAARALRRAR